MIHSIIGRIFTNAVPNLRITLERVYLQCHAVPSHFTFLKKPVIPTVTLPKMQQKHTICFIRCIVLISVVLFTGNSLGSTTSKQKPKGIFRTKEVYVRLSDLVGDFNDRFTAEKIEDKLLQDSAVQIPNVAVKSGETFSRKAIMKKWPEAEKGNLREWLVAKINESTFDPFPIQHYNKSIGFDGEQTILFEDEECVRVEYLLQQHLPGIYGLATIATGLDKGFQNVTKKVFNSTHFLIFEKIPIKPQDSALDNFESEISMAQTATLIDAADKNTDKRKKALGEAIAKFATNSDQKHLDNVKIAWLYVLKGDATLAAISRTGWIIICVISCIFVISIIVYCIWGKKKLDKETRTKI